MRGARNPGIVLYRDLGAEGTGGAAPESLKDPGKHILEPPAEQVLPLVLVRDVGANLAQHVANHSVVCSVAWVTRKQGLDERTQFGVVPWGRHRQVVTAPLLFRLRRECLATGGLLSGDLLNDLPEHPVK